MVVCVLYGQFHIQAQHSKQSVQQTPGGSVSSSNAQAGHHDMRSFGQTSLSSRRSRKRQRNRGIEIFNLLHYYLNLFYITTKSK